MVFSSTLFLCYFLPVFLFVYFLANTKYKNFIILAFSCLFYAWGAPKFIFVIIGTTILDYWFVRWMDASDEKFKRRFLLLLSITMNLGLLVYFKYSNFFVQNFNHALHAIGFKGEIAWTKLVLPIGISFYTFETMTYVVDVYRRIHKPLKNFWEYQLYIIFFPKLIAGPIIRYHEIADQITDRSAADTVDNKLMGFYRFCLGLAKKVLIANTLAAYVDTVYGNEATQLAGIGSQYVTAGTAWIAAFAYTLQIYFDFSGYSDMAIGIGRMLGFRFPENFNNPYISENITEFWRRWHMTLGTWMRNYLYIPLGGNRVSTKRLYFNLWLVFLLSGLWHGASWNFVIWGAWHGFFLVMERSFLLKITSKIGRIPRVVLTFFIVMIGWVFFRVEHLHDAVTYLKAMFFLGHGMQGADVNSQLLTTFVIAILFTFFCFFKRGDRIQQYVYFGDPKAFAHIGLTLVALVLFIVSLSYVTSSGYNPFIYFRF